ncbi:hypothetical protein AY600_15505 [Phormidium willei BDU 130791]|nr:hypothetical protein AY600_15505 [Phormidium willei BDU 130791]
MNVEEFISWDETELEPESQEEVLSLLLRAIANNEGAGFCFVQASPQQGEIVLQRLQTQFRRVSVLDLDRQSQSLYPEAMKRWQQERFDVLVVRGLEQAILGYEDAKRALGWETHDLHQYDTQDIPAILSHLNQVRECWRNNLRTAVVLIVPPFVIRYFIWRCPDFYDWRVGTFVLPEDEEIYKEKLDN